MGAVQNEPSGYCVIFLDVAQTPLGRHLKFVFYGGQVVRLVVETKKFSKLQVGPKLKRRVIHRRHAKTPVDLRLNSFFGHGQNRAGELFSIRLTPFVAG